MTISALRRLIHRYYTLIQSRTSVLQFRFIFCQHLVLSLAFTYVQDLLRETKNTNNQDVPRIAPDKCISCLLSSRRGTQCHTLDSCSCAGVFAVGVPHFPKKKHACWPRDTFFNGTGRVLIAHGRYRSLVMLLCQLMSSNSLDQTPYYRLFCSSGPDPSCQDCGRRFSSAWCKH